MIYRLKTFKNNWYFSLIWSSGKNKKTNSRGIYQGNKMILYHKVLSGKIMDVLGGHDMLKIPYIIIIIIIIIIYIIDI